MKKIVIILLHVQILCGSEIRKLDESKVKKPTDKKKEFLGMKKLYDQTPLTPLWPSYAEQLKEYDKKHPKE